MDTGTRNQLGIGSSCRQFQTLIDFEELLNLLHFSFLKSVQQLARMIRGILFPPVTSAVAGEIRYLEDTEREEGYDSAIAAFDMS